MAEFECRKCDKEFKADWDFGEEVTCPHCGTEWSTDWETDAEDNIYGPWLSHEIRSP